MELLGKVSKVDCDVTPASQRLSVSLYKLVCGNDGAYAYVDEVAGALLADQRFAEVQIINEMLMKDAYAGAYYRSFGEEALVVLDCARAFGGICVINPWNETFIHITTFRPRSGHIRDEIWMQPWYFLENQTPTFEIEGDMNQSVLNAASMVVESRYYFDHPEARPPETPDAGQDAGGQSAVDRIFSYGR